MSAHTKGALQILLMLSGNLLWFLLIKNGTDYVAFQDQSLIYVWLAIIGVVTAAFAWTPYDNMPAISRRFLKASAVFLVLYFGIEPFTMPRSALPADHPAVGFHEVARWIGLAISIAGFFRPSAVFGAAMLLWMFRDLNSAMTGFYFSDLDIRNVCEVIAFSGGGMILAATARRWTRCRDTLALDAHFEERAAIIVFAAGVGGHLGNYFYSAIAKLSLDGGVFSWVFGNQLYDGLLGAMEKGTMPTAFSPWLTQLVYDAVRIFNYPLIIFSFCAQAFALIAPWRRRWILAATLTFDLFHIVVYATFGLLFWKWIALNSIILSTLLLIRDDQWTRSVKVVCIIFVLAGAPFFKTATLAWYDVSNFVSVFFEAETEDGERIRIPNAYFGSASYQVSQGRIYVPPETGHFNFNIWGSVLTSADRDAARNCAPPDRGEPWEERYGPLEAVERYVETHHRDVLNKIGPDGKVNYYLVPHHHLPSLGVDDPFYDLDKRDIAAYYYVFESVCLELEKGELQRKVLKRSEFPVYRPEG
ncbi:MAG: hypothetical protein AAF869_00090 [Pseudomonadota bacterium]